MEKMMEKLCLFCTKFKWAKETTWGEGSTLTGPMIEGGDANCAAGHSFPVWKPENEDEFRRIILTAAECPDYDQVKPQS